LTFHFDEFKNIYIEDGLILDNYKKKHSEAFNTARSACENPGYESDNKIRVLFSPALTCAPILTLRVEFGAIGGALKWQFAKSKGKTSVSDAPPPGPRFD
jgi:hypothetical protein